MVSATVATVNVETRIAGRIYGFDVVADEWEIMLAQVEEDYLPARDAGDELTTLNVRSEIIVGWTREGWDRIAAIRLCIIALEQIGARSR